MNPDHTERDIAPVMVALAGMRQKIVLLGAGATGGYVLRHLRTKGIEPVAVADNNAAKWGTSIKGGTCIDGIEGVRIMSPESAIEAFPDAVWVACAISRPAATELRAQLKTMGVQTKPLWEVLPVCHGLPPHAVIDELIGLSADFYSKREVKQQWSFRCAPDYDRQDEPFNVKDIYFPDFITHLDRESFVDCGAARGDTVSAFCERWKSWGEITAFEPDRKNFAALHSLYGNMENCYCAQVAVGDADRKISFTETGDYSAHIDYNGESLVQCVTLDSWSWEGNFNIPPTYIKFDIEGFEPNALWGARKILKEYKPVLAVCAYHDSEHLWQIPLLIHAIQPDYKLFLRRYGEGAFELVWYAVPPERVKGKENTMTMEQIAVSDFDCHGIHEPPSRR